ncbi:MAG: DUF4476 domain-containing protein [Aureispira sp.]
MKNILYIIALLLSTTLVLSAQNREPLASTKSGSQEHYGRNDYNNNNGRRGNSYNHRSSGDTRRGGDYRNNGRSYGNNGNNGRHGGGYYGNNNGHHSNGHGHNNGHGHHNTGNGYGHHTGNRTCNSGHGQTVSRRHGHRYVGYCNYNNHNYGWAPVTISVFNGCRQRIRHCGFESDRVREAMAFVDHHYVSANQIADIMHFFNFESSRLEFAKYAFHRTCDIQNYGVVFGELTFNSSRRELDCYIRDYHW